MAEFKPTFGEDTLTTKVLRVEEPKQLDLHLVKGQSIEVRWTNQMPANLLLSDGSVAWFAHTVFEGDTNRIMEIFVPYTGVYSLVAAELKPSDLKPTSKDKSQQGAS